MADYMLEVNNLKKYFPIYKGLLKKQVGEVKAVDDISLQIPRGKTIAVVGESGSGKTTLAKAIMRFHEPTAGSIIYDGRDITHIGESELKKLRQEMQMVHQDPSSSLNPRKRIKDILEEPLIIHKVGTKVERIKRVKELLEIVELPQDFLYRYPHSLSGGQKQRIGIARALALNPRFICLDEPTSALDVSVQAKIVALLKRLQQEFDLTYLFITHDLSLVRNFADIVAVMYLGSIVEYAEVETLYTKPQNPYTQSLLSSIPVVSEEEQSMLPAKIPLKGEIPSPSNMPSGCRFHTRCPYKKEICMTPPDLFQTEEGSLVRCHLVNESKEAVGV
ncbi:ATP-binding cassette domain-containing protein [Brevibacillus humidisoli]|uniref:ABC transporter ATP-binding protein n=1 Tax=Brevibacillus humidisoli TaxID=2895522 RepID=UPI001E446325|nr:oligopeptide/dipeptide ABC transporter ATP-binding protein [Brevibacillus humidisoli]UFJ39263.1 ATP-binding cassette domain-containing protein [Brevibacillus humidisoli]